MSRRFGLPAAFVCTALALATEGLAEEPKTCADGECVVFVNGAGAWDVVLADAGKAAPK